MTRILITGVAGFIGFHLASRLLRDGYEIHGCDSLTPYYDVRLKRARCAYLQREFGFRPSQIDLCNATTFATYFESIAPDVVVNLAAQPGVRQGLEQPHLYVNSNVVGFTNVLDMCRRLPPKHLLYASSSSVYGANSSLPWREEHITDSPLSLYGATKKANELMAYSYSHATQVPMTGLRFFTVYGEWGRPDMAPYKFAEAIRSGKEIVVYNFGKMSRDFTYVDDAVEAIARLLNLAPALSEEIGTGTVAAAPHRVVNIGLGQPILLNNFISVLEKTLGQHAQILYADKVSGDVMDTWASGERLKTLTGFCPTISIEDGLARFCAWLRLYSSN